jgi:putative IMPACT (imprinted ancient) family translation regulator
MELKQKAIKLVNKYTNKAYECNEGTEWDYDKECAIISVKNEYHALRELLFNLKSCGVDITEKVYLFRLDELLNEEIDLIREIRKL